MQKIGLGILLFISVIFFGFANDPTTEGGYRFGKAKLEGLEENQKTMIEILKEMLQVQKEQLKTQNEILALLKEEYDPTPKEITLEDGTKCIANSSAKCFQLPLTSTAKRIPVMKNWVTNPTKENAKEYLKWQAKYIQQMTKSGTSFDIATATWGKEAHPLNYTGSTIRDNYGIEYGPKKKGQLHAINSLRDDIMIYLFLGKNANLDLLSFEVYHKLFSEIKDIDLNIVFFNEGSKRALEEESKVVETLGMLFKRADSVIVDEKLFDKYNIYTTPTMGVYQYEKDKYDSLLIGQVSKPQLMSKLLGYTEFEGLIDYGDVVTYESWDKYGEDSIKRYYKRFYDYSGLKTKDIYDEYKRGVQDEK